MQRFLRLQKSSLRGRLCVCQVRHQSTIPTVELPPENMKIVPSVHDLTPSSFTSKDFQGSLVAHLYSRNLIETLTSDDLYKITEHGNKEKLKLYCGADPTAESLHLGNLLPLMVLLHFVLRGHDVVGLVGGATGVVGDPSGRTSERSAMEAAQREKNVRIIQEQIQTFLKRGIDYAKSRNIEIAKDDSKLGSIQSVNNADWWKSVKLLDFLATYGRHIRVSQMLARDSISSRLESQQGIGFNEFTYQILQAYDFWHLFQNEGVNLQIGGNDQWGNITAGIDLISRLQKSTETKSKAEKEHDSSAFGITVPLLTTPSGQKFGKSAGNAVFISEKSTTPFQMYQFFINSQDEMVFKLLKIMTLLPLEAIETVIVPKHEKDPGLRIAQRILAREVVDLIHGNGVGDEMAYITSFLFPTPDQPFDDDITADKLISKFRKSGILRALKLSSFPDPTDLKMSTLLSSVLEMSKNETKALIRAGGVYLGIDRRQFVDPDDVVLFDKENHLIDGKLLLVRTGKQKYYVVEVSE
ncbi:putative tyrosine--tRNA ligase [Clavispora lusitaniae]|uniref:Tyrosine--tRNA ligase n=1 Tax=Clavispora lusitaniae TaxID=36911 RepID=A0AA91PYC7_CLALS|nr:putative tyrosine--tRNA ligase [Clavispora lusitaniae]